MQNDLQIQCNPLQSTMVFFTEIGKQPQNSCESTKDTSIAKLIVNNGANQLWTETFETTTIFKLIL
jgi:hypothetical protein